MRRIKHVADLVDWRLCLGCGACAWRCPEDRIRLLDFPDEGIRPQIDRVEACGDCIACLEVCPAVQTDFAPTPNTLKTATTDRHFARKWGPVLEMWEGFASDPIVRYQGSSGGALTAIAAYCVEEMGMHGVLHIGEDPDDPIRNRTRLSRHREDLLAATGSRYSPASVCNGLELIEQAPSTCCVIGKPSEIAALRNAQGLSGKLDENVGVALSFFCAETPATEGTVALLKKMGISPSSLANLRYRGMGWPGHFAPRKIDETQAAKSLTYHKSWAFLQTYRPWSVQLWPDGTGELADISCGDPWYEEPDGKNPGFSLVVVRTERGKEIIRGAIDAGYLTLKPAEKWKLENSQASLIRKKGAVWGRLVMMKLMRLPTPKFLNGHLFHCWLRLPLDEKLRSTLGTLRRIIFRGINTRLTSDISATVPVKPALDLTSKDRAAGPESSRTKPI